MKKIFNTENGCQVEVTEKSLGKYISVNTGDVITGEEYNKSELLFAWDCWNNKNSRSEDFDTFGEWYDWYIKNRVDDDYVYIDEMFFENEK